MDSASMTPEQATAAGTRGRLACAAAGAGYFLAALFGGGLVGAILYFLISPLYKQEADSWYYIQYEGQSLVLLMVLAALPVGGWFGMRCFKPAATAAGGKVPKPPLFTGMVMRSRRGSVALLGAYLIPRWQLLTGASDAPWRWLPRVMAAIVLVTAIGLPIFLRRDAEFFSSAWICGGIAVIIGDCLLVNKIAQWRTTGRLKPL